MVQIRRGPGGDQLPRFSDQLFSSRKSLGCAVFMMTVREGVALESVLDGDKKSCATTSWFRFSPPSFMDG
jgi:hypothetical protein